jgi:16S rRNA (cytosine1402-N4)-methyltransferase
MHQPVLLKDVLDLMGIRPGGSYIDGTLGGGGHSEAILERAGEGGRLLGLDQDLDAVERVRARLKRFGDRCRMVHGNFADMTRWAAETGFQGVDGVLLDLGVSSFQLDLAERGFSFMHDGPLDMRMDRSASLTAARVVNEWSEERLRQILFEYGEESMARRIAGSIVRERLSAPIVTTLQLAGIVEKAAGGRRGRIHPATKTFQGLRIAVNDELGAVNRGLDAALGLLKPGGRLAVIAFHSLEDRPVKQFMRAHAGRWMSLYTGGREWAGELPPVRILTKRPVVVSEEERESNPRARSAKLRVCERVEQVGKREEYDHVQEEK